MNTIAAVLAAWNNLPASGPVRFHANLHGMPGGQIATQPVTWDAIHQDNKIGPHLATSQAYQALEQTLRNPPAGADWTAAIVHPGFNSQMVHSRHLHEYLIRVELPDPTSVRCPNSPFHRAYYEFFITTAA